MDKPMFKVVEHKFNPSAVGQPRLVKILGVETNLPQTTTTTGRIVARKLPKERAESLCNKLNAKQDFNGDLDVILSYTVRPESPY